MADINYSEPIDKISGTLSKKQTNNRIFIHRQKVFGKEFGCQIPGPRESYAYHIHQGPWSEGATQNRQLFQQALNSTTAELADPERNAYWKQLFLAQLKHPKKGQKQYVSFRGFVSASILAQLKTTQPE